MSSHVIRAREWLRQEDHGFQGSLGSTDRPLQTEVSLSHGSKLPKVTLIALLGDEEAPITCTLISFLSLPRQPFAPAPTFAPRLIINSFVYRGN